MPVTCQNMVLLISSCRILHIIRVLWAKAEQMELFWYVLPIIVGSNGVWIAREWLYNLLFIASLQEKVWHSSIIIVPISILYLWSEIIYISTFFGGLLSVWIFLPSIVLGNWAWYLQCKKKYTIMLQSWHVS